MKVTELIPTPTSKIALEGFEEGSLPSGCHSHVLTDDSGDILFIGATKYLNHILKLHSEKFAKLKGIEGKINCYFIGSSEEEYLKIETSWMEQHRAITGKYPSCNVIVNI